MSTVQEQVKHPIFARVFAAGEGQLARSEREQRSQMLAGVRGDVIEIGCGSGLNFRYYPGEVTRILAVEPESYLRERAVQNAKKSAVPVEVVDGLAQDLPAPDASFDAAVASLVLCSVSDQAASLAEMFRVLRPGGELRFFEHVVSPRAGVARYQRVIDKLIWPRVAGGCHLTRDTAAAIAGAGFVMERLERLTVSPMLGINPAAPHIIGLARKPSPGERA